MSKANKPIDQILEDITPVLTINEDYVFAEYYPDLSGWVEITAKEGHQLYCDEDGTLKTQLQGLKDYLVEREEDTRRLKKALALLEKKAKDYLK